MGPPGSDGDGETVGEPLFVPGVSDHGLLLGLLADHHRQYALLAGRTGTTNDLILSTDADGTITGSLATDGQLILLAGAHLSSVVPRVVVIPDIGNIGSATAMGMEFCHDAGFNNAGSILNGMTVSEHGTWLVTANLSGALTVGGRCFVAAPDVQNDANRTDLGYYAGFFSAVSVNSAAGTTISAATLEAFRDTNVVGRPGVNLGTLTADSVTSFNSNPSLQSTATITTRRGLWYNASLIAGTLVNSLAIEIADHTATTQTTGIRSRLTSGTGKWGLAMGTADNTIAGRIFLGGTIFTVPNTDLDIDGDFATRAADLALANGNNDNIAIGARSFIRITGPTAAFAIRGIASGFNGKRVVIYNTTTQIMTINHEDAGSTAANRIRTMTGVATATAGEGITEFIYDATQSRWLQCYINT